MIQQQMLHMQDLESHFNNISLRPGTHGGLTIQEHQSPDDSPGRRGGSKGALGGEDEDGMEPEIEIPSGTLLLLLAVFCHACDVVLLRCVRVQTDAGKACARCVPCAIEWPHPFS